MLEEVGLGPKLVQRIGRLQRFLALAESQGHPYRLAWLAQAAGYADQAHLNREVRALAGVTPRELLSERARATLATAGSGSDAAARVG
jgi:AraC-like DNA-binding protein